ncbi:MAG: hemD [Ilumatobacteraceae bacterium]|nr:hemD [Ilumatobacteraceae bacterium]
MTPAADDAPLVLAGRRIVITRAADQAEPLAERLRALGAEAVLLPLIEIGPPTDAGLALAAALGRLMDFDWLVITSPNGAARVRDALDAHGSGPRVAAVGRATADALAPRDADLVPTVQNAHGLAAVFPTGSGRVLIAQAEDAESTLADGLRDLGWTVEVAAAYRTAAVTPSAAGMQRAGDADAVLLASGSAARAWVQSFGVTDRPRVVSIGPSTTRVAAELGLKVHVTATDNSLDGLVAAVVAFCASH